MKNNLKNFFEDIILEIKNKLFSSKYVLKGKCKRCGRCCRNILFSTKEGYIKDENIFKDMQKKYRYYKNFRISGKIENKQDFQNGALTFECKFISKNNKCLIYPIRPIFCRDYPNINPELIYNGVKMLDECGFYFDVNKKFEEYLN
ncbi:MAG: YkgJ family cysteine cluster protein [Candidatus Gastranaerophilales bacterium]|nr:YkgJ family cysteine cluster protein [Candidatus Gastranaerophilales bacterium]